LKSETTFGSDLVHQPASVIAWGIYSALLVLRCNQFPAKDLCVWRRDNPESNTVACKQTDSDLDIIAQLDRFA
jgi:hypothetical protein